MKQSKFFPLIFLSLTSCQIFPSVSVSLSSSLSSIPIPSDEFNPIVDGRSLLIETKMDISYATVTLMDLNPLPLASINFPKTEMVTAYAVADATAGNFENQLISFSNESPNLTSTFNHLSIGSSLSSQETLTTLLSLQATDESFNQKSVEIRQRNLSHVYFGSPYYWFNNYVLQEQLQIARYPNQVIYGEGSQSKTFQTGVSINIGVATQLFASGTTIYEIRDETYPPGFFGARDYKYETIRTQDNFKSALTMGPITELLNAWRMGSIDRFPPGFTFQQSIENFTKRLSVTKLAQDTFIFLLEFFQGEDVLTAEETYTLTATLKANQWERVSHEYRLWEPPVSA